MMVVAHMSVLCGDQQPPFILALAGKCLDLRQVHCYGPLDIEELKGRRIDKVMAKNQKSLPCHLHPWLVGGVLSSTRKGKDIS